MSALRRVSTSAAARLLSNPSRPCAIPVCIFCQHVSQPGHGPRRAPFSTAGKRHNRHGSVLEQSVEKSRAVKNAPGAVESLATQGDSVGDRIEEDITLADDAQANQDARLYAEQLRREKKLAFQAQIDDASTHQDYVPATSWLGMETVGGEKEFDTGKTFHGFLRVEKLKTAEEITAAIYRAVVEIFAALGAGRTPRTSKFYNVGSLVNEALQVKIELTKAEDPTGEGKVRLSYPSSVIEQAVLRAGSPTTSTLPSTPSTIDKTEEEVHVDITSGEVVETASYTPESLKAMISSWGRTWLHIPLQDPKLKLAIVKRINRLTGTPIPDHVIHNATSVSWLVSSMVKNKGTQKLFDSLSADGKLEKLPNVTVMGRRETPVDKEMQVGRWKLIEAELKRRDLPVLGRG